MPPLAFVKMTPAVMTGMVAPPTLATLPTTDAFILLLIAGEEFPIMDARTWMPLVSTAPPGSNFTQARGLSAQSEELTAFPVSAALLLPVMRWHAGEEEGAHTLVSIKRPLKAFA